MRIATRILLSFALLSFGLAGSAWALPFTGVTFLFDGEDDEPVSGTISSEPDAASTNVTFKITLDSGSQELEAISIRVVTASGGFRHPLSSTGLGPTGDTSIEEIGFAGEFDDDDDGDDGSIGTFFFEFDDFEGGQMTGAIFVDHDALAVGDTLLFGSEEDTVTSTVIPEPSTALLLALGLAALAMWTRRV